MQIDQPITGRTYISRNTPELLIYVVDVKVYGDDEVIDTAFVVEGCDPTYKEDPKNADGLDFSAEMWRSHDFILSPD